MYTKSSKRFLTLYDIVQDHAQMQGNARAATYLTDGEVEGAHLTYAQVCQRMCAMAAWLQQMARPGDRVILFFSPGLEIIPAFLGCMAAGMVAVPIWPPRTLQGVPDSVAVITGTQASVILTSARDLPRLKPLLAWLPACQCEATDLIPDALASTWKPTAIREEDVAALQFTSGSTKAPRGIQLSHRQLFALLNTPIANPQAPKGESTFVSWLPLQSSMGALLGGFMPFFEGEHTVLISPMDFGAKPVRWLRAISNYRAVSSGGPNFAYQLCVDRIPPEDCAGLKLDSWRFIQSIGEPIRAGTFEAFARKFTPFGLPTDKFHFCYGLTEAGLVSGRHGLVVTMTLDRQALERNEAVAVSASDSAAQTFVSVGAPFEGEALLLVNPQTRTVCGPDSIGEIWVQSPTVADGYWGQAEETQTLFQAHLADGRGPFLRTGDLGFMKAGELYITGRIKDIIILHGKNIYVQDIEQTAELAHPALQPGASAAFGINVQDEEQLGLALEVRAGAVDLDLETIIRAVRRAIADEYQVPVQTVVLVAPNSLPRTAAGKVQRFLVRERVLKETQV